MNTWMDYPWLGFDTETTGVNEDEDLILSSALLQIGADKKGRGTNYQLINWGVPVPPESTAIHGLTQEMIEQDGIPPADALELICRRVFLALTGGGAMLVGMNVVFDLTMLDRNCRRAGVTPLSERCQVRPVIDVRVLDKYVDPYRKGRRNLNPALAEHYGASLDGAHNAVADARAAMQVAWRLGRVFQSLGAMEPNAIHDLQVRVKPEQDKDFREYLMGKDSNADVRGLDGHWPIRPWKGQP